MKDGEDRQHSDDEMIEEDEPEKMNAKESDSLSRPIVEVLQPMHIYPVNVRTIYRIQQSVLTFRSGVSFFEISRECDTAYVVHAIFTPPFPGVE